MLSYFVIIGKFFGLFILTTMDGLLNAAGGNSSNVIAQAYTHWVRARALSGLRNDVVKNFNRFIVSDPLEKDEVKSEELQVFLQKHSWKVQKRITLFDSR